MQRGALADAKDVKNCPDCDQAQYCPFFCESVDAFKKKMDSIVLLCLRRHFFGEEGGGKGFEITNLQKPRPKLRSIFPSPATIFILSSLSWGLLVDIGGDFEGRDPSNVQVWLSGCV